MSEISNEAQVAAVVQLPPPKNAATGCSKKNERNLQQNKRSSGQARPGSLNTPNLVVLATVLIMF